MPLQRFLIAPYNEGLVNNLKPWLIPDKAFNQLNNAYTFRGRVRKRWGSVFIENNASNLQSRLRIDIGVTDAFGNFPLTQVPGSIFQIGQQFSIGATIFTVTTAGPAGMLSTVAGQTGNFDTGAGMVEIFTAALATRIYYYPSTPVMGITNYDTPAINFEPTYPFDQQFAYQYSIAVEGFVRLGTAQWSGTNSNFVWGRMFANTNPDTDWLVVVNNKAVPVVPFAGPYDVLANVPVLLDGIKYYESGFGDWTNFVPLARGAVPAAGQLRITGARICIEFKGRLLLFAPYEANNCVGNYNALTLNASTQIDNRVRYSWQESLDARDLLANINDCFFEASGKGGYIDAPTTESITTVQFVKDRLVVYFERSTFELAYTGAPDQPFVWQKIDTSLGAESTFSEVPFDDFVLGIGQRGIHACNGATVKRIDDKIPDEVFGINNVNNGIERVAGIRDYFTELVYWTFPVTPDGTFPDKILLYDYKNLTWAKFDDSYTAWGYHNLNTGFVWSRWHRLWQETHWPWSFAENNQRFHKIVAGNQEGFIIQIDHGSAANSPALSITNLLGNTITCINHNLAVESYVQISQCVGSLNLNDSIVRVMTVAVDGNSFTFDGPAADAGYTGGGILARVSNVEIRTKEYNFFTDSGQQTFVPYIDFLIDRTTSGQHSVDFFLSSAARSMVADGTASGAIVGSSLLETFPFALLPLEQYQDRIWHRTYFQASGDTVQLRVYYTDAQMKDRAISLQPFVMHAMLIHAAPEGTRLGES